MTASFLRGQRPLSFHTDAPQTEPGVGSPVASHCRTIERAKALAALAAPGRLRLPHLPAVESRNNRSLAPTVHSPVSAFHVLRFCSLETPSCSARSTMITF